MWVLISAGEERNTCSNSAWALLSVSMRVAVLDTLGRTGRQVAHGRLVTRPGDLCWRAASASRACWWPAWTTATFHRCALLSTVIVGM